MAATVPAIMPGSIRLYVDTPLSSAARVELTAEQAHYLGTVMRRRSNDPLRLFNGQDGEFHAVIDTIRRDRAVLTLGELLRPQAVGSDRWLAFALLKRDATDLVVQKATELGASRLLPVLTERCNTHRTNEARLKSIAIEAAEQSERLTVPILQQPKGLTELLAGWPPARPLFAAIERSDAALLRPVSGPAGLLVGPEGGFTQTELDALRSHPFVTTVSLGPNVLRAETACIAGLAMLQATDRAEYHQD